MKNIRKQFLAAVFPVFLFIPAVAGAETVSGAMAKAYENNPDLNAARAGLRATDEGVTIAKAGYRPHINASASATAARSNTSLGTRDIRSSSVALSITQMVFDGFRTLNSVRAAEANVFSQREALRATEISILLAAAESYANVARDRQIVSIRKQNLAFLNEQLNAANARLQVGEGTRTDVAQAQAQLAASKSALAAAIAQLKASEAVYYQIVGAAPKDIRQPKPASRGIPSSVDAAVAAGMRDHPSVLAAMHNVDSAGFTVKSAEGAMLPGVSLSGSVSRSYSSATPTTNGNSAAITATLTVPIYQGGAEYGAIRQAKERLSQTRITVDSVRLSVQQAIVSSYAQYEAARAATQASRAQLAAANLALEGVIEERNVGQATTLDVLNAQASVLSAKESVASSARNAVVASYSVLAAIGHLTIESQGLRVAEYKPEVHYEAVKDAWFGLRTVGDR